MNDTQNTIALPPALSSRLRSEKERAEAEVAEFLRDRQARLNDTLNMILDGFILSLDNGDIRKFKLSDDMSHLVEQ